MHIKQHPVDYKKPRPFVVETPSHQLCGFDDVMLVLRRIKYLPDFIINSEQEAIDDRRVISWRIGNTREDHSMTVMYNFTFVNEWFSIIYAPVNVTREPELDELYELGEDYPGPNGAYSYSQATIVEFLEKIESMRSTLVAG